MALAFSKWTALIFGLWEAKMADLADFVEPVNDNFICGICEGVLVKPMCCREGHSYCEGCITRWLAEKQECPVDRSRLTRKTLTNNRPLDSVREYMFKVPSTISRLCMA